jgi:hypothetical protein
MKVTSFILGLGMIIGEQAMYSAGRENGRILCVVTLYVCGISSCVMGEFY